MAAPTTTDLWDEYVTAVVAAADITRVTSINVGLYDDATDQITSTDDIGAITTEPSGNGYSTKTVDLTTSASAVQDGTDWKSDVDDQQWSGLSFGSATDVDAWYISLDVQLSGDGSATEHLMAVGELTGGPYDLQNYTDFTAQDIGIRQTQA